MNGRKIFNFVSWYNNNDDDISHINKVHDQ
jgi:hypothetical protein